MVGLLGTWAVVGRHYVYSVFCNTDFSQGWPGVGFLAFPYGLRPCLFWAYRVSFVA